jgi:hypothetical protein
MELLACYGIYVHCLELLLHWMYEKQIDSCAVRIFCDSYIIVKNSEEKGSKGNLCYQSFFLIICRLLFLFHISVLSYHKIHCDMVVNSSRGCITQ